MIKSINYIHSNQNEIEKVNTNNSNFSKNIKEVETELLSMPILDDIHDFFLPNSNDAQLRKMNMSIEELGKLIDLESLREDQIVSITDCGPDGKNKKVQIKTGNTENGTEFECLLVYENGEYKLSSITTKDGKTINCNLSENQIKRLRKEFDIPDDVEIVGVHYIKINGTTKEIVMLKGADSSLIDLYLEAIYSAIDTYPPSAIDKIFSCPDFYGFVFGPSYKELDSLYNAYAHGKNYIFLTPTIPLKMLFNNNSYDTIVHEIAHILDAVQAPNGFNYNSRSSQEIKDLYEKYKKIIVEFSTGGYQGYEEIPNVIEFFAKSTTMYLLSPDELKEFMPEVYEYLDEFYKNI